MEVKASNPQEKSGRYKGTSDQTESAREVEDDRKSRNNSTFAEDAQR